jgi:Zn-dependent M28 family amino/carboxypeptidase
MTELRTLLLRWMACLALPLAGLACDSESPSVSNDFDGQRAFADLRDQVALGPRPMGSEASVKTRELITRRLRQAGWPAREIPFSAVGPSGEPVSGVNLIATLQGERPQRIWLGAHYDTKDIPGIRFVGANDGASGVALLLETARVLARRKNPVTYELVFFDGEEAIGPNITQRDGLFGSRALAKSMADAGELEGIVAFVLVDMVADRDLNLTPDRGSARWLQEALDAAAAEQDPELFDRSASLFLVDDHTPFRDAGLADVLALIDFQFGARTMPGPSWHTSADDLESVSAESLNRVGKLLVQALGAMERRAISDQLSGSKADLER